MAGMDRLGSGFWRRGWLILLAGLLWSGVVAGAEEAACYCLHHQDTDEWIHDCRQGKEGDLCIDFKTKEHKAVTIKDRGRWRVVAEGQLGCTPCKYRHPTVILPRGGVK